jgi:hypothetical protein
MDACRIRTQREPRPLEFRLAGDDSAIPVEIITGEVTSPYPLGLCDDLCGLSGCRRREELSGVQH